MSQSSECDRCGHACPHVELSGLWWCPNCGVPVLVCCRHFTYQAWNGCKDCNIPGRDLLPTQRSRPWINCADCRAIESHPGYIVAEKVAAQHRAYRVALPQLLHSPIAGRWIIWLDGVQGDFDTHDGAYIEALERYGLTAGFVITRVEPERVFRI